MPATLIVFLCLSSFLHAQNLNGIWKGNLGMSGGCFAENNLEIQLHIDGNRVYGDCYQYENVNYYVKKTITGFFDRPAKKITLSETVITTFHIHQNCSICIKNFYLSYSKEGNIETLTGNWDGKIFGTGNDCSTGPIILSRTKESAFKEVPEIIVDTGTIRLDFYDNAQVDGDSITVLVDKNVVVSHQRLNTKALTVFLKVDLHNSFHEVEMVAENLGSIPPNTAMLIITAGNNRYQLYLTSTKDKSAMIRFVYDRKVNAPDNQ